MTRRQSSSAQVELQLDEGPTRLARARPGTPPVFKLVPPGPEFKRLPTEGWVCLSIGHWRYHRRDEFTAAWLEEVQGSGRKAHARVRIPLFDPENLTEPVDWLTHWTTLGGLRRKA